MDRLPGSGQGRHSLALERHSSQHGSSEPLSYGSRKMVEALGQMGRVVNRKRVQRLMQQMGLEPWRRSEI